MIKGECLVCKKEFLFYPKRIRKYCSKICFHISTKGKGNPNYKGDIYSSLSKRKANYEGLEITRKYIRNDDGKLVFEHRYIAEKALGRKLKTTEIVHHINCNPTDNRNKNLIICNKAYHQWVHQKMGQLWAQEHFVGATEIEVEAEVIEQDANS